MLFEYPVPHITGRVTFAKNGHELPFDTFLSLDELINNDSEDTFLELLKRFMNKNAVAGVQPKTMVIVSDKGQLESREYIIKTWGQEFLWLAENEYFSMRSMQKAGVIIPKIYISINKRFLIVEKFTIDSKGNVFGFEEVLSLMGKNRIYKYEGSY
ncbi:MAG: HipA domain-containing protein [Candidatus Methanofastidiosa archaeon]|nr:HipA domain-containing protein [Candidatus Methanofastidiosa archaeon]